jgi:hypothetical protein
LVQRLLRTVDRRHAEPGVREDHRRGETQVSARTDHHRHTRRVQGRDDVQRRDDVDLSVELQHGVSAVLVDTQMRSERRGLVAHDDITSNRVTGGQGDVVQRA